MKLMCFEEHKTIHEKILDHVEQETLTEKFARLDWENKMMKRVLKHWLRYYEHHSSNENLETAYGETLAIKRIIEE